MVSKSVRAGLVFLVGRIGRFFRRGGYSKRIGRAPPVMLAAAMDYVTEEVLEAVRNKAIDRKRKRITPNDIFTAMKMDSELAPLLNGVISPGGGVYVPPPAPPAVERSRWLAYDNEANFVSYRRLPMGCALSSMFVHSMTADDGSGIYLRERDIVSRFNFPSEYSLCRGYGHIKELDAYVGSSIEIEV